MAIAKWYKIDIHTHTPASSCMVDKEKSITPREWIDAAKERVDAVVVTDHNSIDWLDRLQKELKDKDKFFIFNGIEVSVGDKGNHIILIFDPDLKIELINEILIKMDLTSEKQGRTDICIDKEKFTSTVNEYRDKLLIIPAHFFSSKGLGNLANHSWIRSYYEDIKFDAIEINNLEEINTLENKICAFDGSLFKGDIEELKSISTIVGSDNPYKENNGKHSIKGIGEKFTWFKLSEFTLEGLRQSFLDPGSRIRKVFDSTKVRDMNTYDHNYISGVKINNLKHLEEINLRLSPNLNCLVGGRGTGKSTIIEMIKNVIYSNNGVKYDKPQLLDSIKKDTEIDLFYNFGTHEENNHLVEFKKGLLKVLKKDNKTGEKVEVDKIEFPVDIYSQKEIYEMVDEEIKFKTSSKSEFLRIIDNNIKLEILKLEEQENNYINKIKDSYSKILNYRKSIADMPQLLSEKTSLDSKFKLIEHSNLIDVIDKKGVLNSVDNLFESYSNDYYNLYKKFLEELEGLNKEYRKKIDDIKGLIIIFEDKINLDMYIQGYENIIENTKKILEKNILEIDKINNRYEKDTSLEEIEKGLEAQFKDIMTTLELEEERNSKDEINKLSSKLNEVNKKIEELEIKKEKSIEEENLLENYLDKLLEVLIEKNNIRKNIVNEINKELDIISVELKLLGDKDRWINNLRKAMGKEDSFEQDYKELGNHIFIDNPVENIKKWFEFIYLEEDRDICKFLNIEKLSHAGFQKIWKGENINYTDFINILPDDQILIKIKKDVTDIRINDASPGEKAAAVLSFIMHQGKGPLIIDQPEDDLDNSLIMDLIVETIRDIKNKRQIIIATHNSNIPVLGDAEAIIILERDQNGFVNLRKNKKAGCIEEKEIKKGICSIMEGGLESFRKRDRKYKL